MTDDSPPSAFTPIERRRVKISDTKAKFLRKNPPNHYWSTITEKLGIRKGNFSK